MNTQSRPDLDVVILAGTRTPFGTFGGALRDLSATDLAEVSGRGALEAAGVSPDQVDQVIYGNALQTSSDAPYLARHVGLRVGVPVGTPALTVNRLCGSGFQAVTQAAQDILLGEACVALAGGTESMSQAPHVLRGGRWGGLRLGPATGAFEDLLWASLLDRHCGLTMAETAEEVADLHGVTRAESDGVAFRSQARAHAAWEAGRFDREIVPVPVGKPGSGEVFLRDEHLRPDTRMEALAQLRPYFRKDGRVTAGNASGIGDGSASLVLASRQWADEHGIRPLARILSWAFVGVEPKWMGLGPVPAIQKALARAQRSLDDINLVEVNEAFGPQVAAVERVLELDPAKTNVDGGAIALTHPLGASGARILVHLLHELRRRGGGMGVGSACIGGGQGAAVVIEVFPPVAGEAS
jgi:acetyl-CoA acyltransferase 2